MVREVEMSAYGSVCTVCNGMSMRIHSLSERLFRLSYVLFGTFPAVDEVNDSG